MKPNIIILLCLVSLLLSLSGCREIEINTRVHDNGMLSRKMMIKQDDMDIPDMGYPFPHDKSWNFQTIKIDSGDVNYLLVTEKKFHDAEELNQSLESHFDSTDFRTSVTCQKTFRWFYTVYSYQETLHRIVPFDPLPRDSFFTDIEFHQYRLDDMSKETEDRIERWREESFFHQFYSILQTAARQQQIEGLTLASLTQNRERLYHAATEWDLEKETFTDYFLDTTAVILNLDKVKGLKDRFEKTEDKLFSHYLRILEQTAGEDYTFTVHMPGNLIDTNAEYLENKVPAWKITFVEFDLVDYPLWVKSRKWNTVPLILTGFIILAGVFLILKSRRD